jgi:hypothetical protein
LTPRARTATLLAAAVIIAIGVYASGALDSKDPRPGHAIYVAQNGAGAQDGRGGCGNAHPLAWLNSPDNWGDGDGEVHAGSTVALCGTLTAPIAVAGSGAPGDPITLRFMPSAAIAMPSCPASSGCIDTSSHRYLTIEGSGESAHGTIENTGQGTGRGHESSVGIQALECTGCTIRDLTIANLYVHTSAGDTAAAATEVRGIDFSGSSLTIAHNTLHDLGWALIAEWNPTDGNDRIEHNTIYHIDHGFASTAAFNGGSIGPIYYDHNDTYGYANWDTTADDYHHDGIHCFSGDAVGYEPHYNGLYIYDNRFGGATGEDMTAQIFIEGTPDETPCANPSSNIWIFNNVAADTTTTAFTNGVFGVFSGEPHVYNNTLVGLPTPENTCYSTNDTVTHERFVNNLLTTCSTQISVSNGPSVFAGGGIEHNVYAGGAGQSNAFICANNFYAFNEFADWQRCIHGDGASRTVAGAVIHTSGTSGTSGQSQSALGSEGELESRSPARDAGINLTSLCAGPTRPLCRNISGAPRPRTGPWNAGAY